ncbi:KdsC family phosphatase [Sulfurospirillum sp. 1612]|uniref:KdsC family phosphatase n=1 Tax=Sulfurospirillum sp. 1612 TaxID=3094835 RepID=UPI002F922150
MIELLVLDVDGCMSDGKIIYASNGEEFKNFNVKDGLAIVSWIKLGKKVAIITGRHSSIVDKRSKELGVHYLYQGVSNKKEQLEAILAQEGLGFEHVAAIGDDLNDIAVLSLVGRSYCPNNANHYAKNAVDTVLNCNGGEGAVREMIEDILEHEHLIEDFIKLWQ